MTAHLREAVTAQLMRVEIVPPEEQQPVLPPMEAHKFDPKPARTRWRSPVPRWCRQPAGGRPRSQQPVDRGKVGRNEDCPCGSGKKYKHCHGRYA